MKTSSLVAIIIAIIVVAGGVWYFTAQPAANTAAPVANLNTNPAQSNSDSASTTGANPIGQGTLSVAHNAQLGDFFTATNGMTLYTYSPDKPDVSNCSGQCAVNWPPYVIPDGGLVVNLTPTGTLGTITRADGSTQVTYNHMPLYFYIKDKNPGDTVGQGVGGVWYVVKP